MGPLADPQGVLKTSGENRQLILKHHQNNVHKGIILDLKKREQWKVQNEISNKVEDKKSHYAVTNRHFRLMYSGTTTQFIYKGEIISTLKVTECNHFYWKSFVTTFFTYQFEKVMEFNVFLL